MARRQVTCTTKNYQNEVTHVGGTDQQAVQFYEIESSAIFHIENNIHSYYTFVDGYVAEVVVVLINGRKHLRTKKDGTTKNNLGELPSC